MIPKLGYYNVSYAAWYKLAIKFGWLKSKFPISKSIAGEFFHKKDHKLDYPEIYIKDIKQKYSELQEGVFTYFSYHKFKLGETPDWFYNPFEKKSHSQTSKHWAEISDFGEGDIKIIWEISRFDWLMDLCRYYLSSGDETALVKMNILLNDWSTHNPLNQGPNWKCGQETSIRVMKLLQVAFLLGQSSSPTNPLVRIIEDHVSRIAANLKYAIIQDNNHGTSEASGLYIGSAWLLANGSQIKELSAWKKRGRQVLEERLIKLIQEDGTFSQRSTTYHRMVVDTMTFVLHQMEILKESPFNKNILDRLNKLGEWQYKMTFGKEGDAPNFGSNDGAMLMNMHAQGYRDFRPSTQAFFAALRKVRIYENPDCNEAVSLMYPSTYSSFSLHEIDLPKSEFLDQQILTFRNEHWSVFMKCPEDTFRPGNDVFHIDVWLNGRSILLDCGTFSYNSGLETMSFKSVASHNTVQFSEHEQMPYISRFLNGSWIKPLQNYEWNKINHFSGMYTDYKGNTHIRELELKTDRLVIKDSLKGKEEGVSRFHYQSSKGAEIKVIKGKCVQKASEHSAYYLQKQSIDLLEVSGTDIEVHILRA